MELPGFSVFNPRALHSIKQVNGLIGFSHWMVDFDIPPALEARQGKAFRRSLAKYIGFWIGCWIAPYHHFALRTGAVRRITLSLCGSVAKVILKLLSTNIPS